MNSIISLEVIEHLLLDLADELVDLEEEDLASLGREGIETAEDMREVGGEQVVRIDPGVEQGPSNDEELLFLFIVFDDLIEMLIDGFKVGFSYGVLLTLIIFIEEEEVGIKELGVFYEVLSEEVEFEVIRGVEVFRLMLEQFVIVSKEGVHGRFDRAAFQELSQIFQEVI